MNISFFSRVSFLEKILFAKNLALMIKAGLPLRESIATIQEQTKSKKFQKVLAQVLKDINNGQSLSFSLSRHPSIFDSLYVNMIRVGEESGTLEENLIHLSLHLEKSYRLRRAIQAAMVYPLIILSAVVVLCLGLTFFVLPQIIPIFKAFDVELPLLTRILIQFIETGENYGFYILVGIIGLIGALGLFSRTPAVKFLIHRIFLKLPIIGSMVRNVNISHFSRTLGILLKSGIPVVKALDITRATLGNLVYQKELKKIGKEVEKGKPISDYLKKKETVFPLMVSRMVGVGEKTGKLEETLLYVGDFYEEEVDKYSKTLSTILEPILLLIIGGVVGFVALAIITPIYEITKGLHF